MAKPRLIADIGGTNARFALLHSTGGIDTIKILPCTNYPTLSDAISAYLVDLNEPKPEQAAIAVATPVETDHVKFTNHVWSFSIAQTRADLNFSRLTVLNDFTALALALPHLTPDQRYQIGTGIPQTESPIALIGPGTGLGVSGLIWAGSGWVSLQSEGGHVTYGAATPRESEILAIMGQRFNHVSAERLMAGPGWVNVYHAIAELSGAEPQPLTPAEITTRGLAGTCPLCVEVLETFCGMLGTAAGNLVLTLGAKGGVYIGGGIVPKLGDFFERSAFRQRFEHRGRFSDYLKAVPSYVITAPYPALLGAAQAFSEPPPRVGVTSLDR